MIRAIIIIVTTRKIIVVIIRRSNGRDRHPHEDDDGGDDAADSEHQGQGRSRPTEAVTQPVSSPASAGERPRAQIWTKAPDFQRSRAVVSNLDSEGSIHALYGDYAVRPVLTLIDDHVARQQDCSARRCSGRSPGASRVGSCTRTFPFPAHRATRRAGRSGPDCHK